MRLHADLDKIEAALTRRQAENELSQFVFPPAHTARTKSIDIAAVLRHSFLFLLFLVACGAAFVITLPAISAVYVTMDYNVTHTHSIPWHFLVLIWRMGIRHIWNSIGPANILLGLAAAANMAFLFAVRWAWNRRADRLNREPSLPSAAVADVPGVWPPPPIERTMP